MLPLVKLFLLILQQLSGAHFVSRRIRLCPYHIQDVVEVVSLGLDDLLG